MEATSDRNNELEKEFEEVHHRLGRLRDSLLLGNLQIDPYELAPIIKDIPETDTDLTRDDKIAKMPLSKQRAIRRFMEMERCHDDFGDSVDHLWFSGLDILEDRAKNPTAYETDVWESEGANMEFDIIVGSILDGMGKNEKSRLIAGCTRLDKGKPLGGSFTEAEHKALSHLMHIRTQIVPMLNDCAKRFRAAVEPFESEAHPPFFDPSHSVVPTVVFGHKSWALRTLGEGTAATEKAIREYRIHDAAPECFLDSFNEDLEWRIGASLKEYLTKTSGCDLESIRTALSPERFSVHDSRFDLAKGIQTAYAEIVKHEAALPDLTLALCKDYHAHPGLYADDLSCHAVSESELERRYPILKLIPLRLRHRLLWGHEHQTAVESSRRLTEHEKRILRIPKFKSLDDAIAGIMPDDFFFS